MYFRSIGHPCRHPETTPVIILMYTYHNCYDCSNNKQYIAFLEASIEVVYAKAVKDYANVTDSSSLTLHMGDVVLVSCLIFLTAVLLDFAI